MTPTYAARKDANHQEIVAALKLAGYRVVDTSRAGFGVPDLFVLSKAQRFVALEVKSTSGGLTDDEQRMFDYIGSGAPLYTVKCVEPHWKRWQSMTEPRAPYLRPASLHRRAPYGADLLLEVVDETKTDSTRIFTI